MIQMLFTVGVLASAASAAPAAPSAKPASSDADKPGLAVLDLVAGYGAKPELAKFLNEIMLTALRQTGRFQTVIAGSDIKQMLDLEQQKTALGCDEASCLAELGGALGVPYLASGQLGKLGATYRITVKLISVDDGQVVAREMGKAKDEESAAELLQELVIKVAATVAGPQKAEHVAAPPVEAAERKSQKTSSWRPPAGAGLIATALGLTGWRWLQFTDRKASFEQAPSTDRADAYIASADAAQTNLWLSGGLAAVGLYLVLGAAP